MTTAAEPAPTLEPVTGVRGSGRRAVLGAVSATAVVVLPVFLVGGLSVLINQDLPLSATGLGGLVSAYFATCALCSVPTGRLVERYGAARTTRAGILLASASLLLIAVAARTYVVLLGCLILAGAANALAQLGSNLSLARTAPRHRLGLSFGVKQSAIPITTLLVGVAIPSVGLTLGWRWAFVIAAALSLAAVPLVAPERGGHLRRGRAERNVRTTPLLVLSAAALLASGMAGVLGTFLVAAAVDRGTAESTAGLVLSAGGGVGVVARLAAGWLADRRTGGHLSVVAVLVACGAGGMMLLAMPGTPFLALGTLAGFGLGWAWPGLLNFAVVQLNPGAPAAATSITQTGVYLGGALGPLAFGGLVEATSYPTAWLAAAVVMAAAALLMLTGGRMLRAG